MSEITTQLDISSQQTMASPLSAMVRRSPVSCLPDTPLRSALKTMHELNIGSMVVTDSNLAPLGIFTLRDMLDRVALAGYGLELPISGVMTRDVYTMTPQTSAYEAALAMIRHGIRHILVVARGQLVGIVSEKDLFSLQRINIRQLAGAIHEADSLDQLIHFSADIRQLALNMLAQGVAARQLTHFIASLNDLLTQRIIDLELIGAELDDDVRMCWMALGSEGRFEKTLSTDQDNGIIFAGTSDAASLRSRLLPFAQRVNDALASCGFPLCKGNVMANNPQWCLSEQEWQAKFAYWIDSGDPQALLHGAIFFDLRGLHGDIALVDKLQDWLLSRTGRNPRFLHQMAANALRNRPPLGFLHDFVTAKDAGHLHTIDLKMNAATLFVDAGRIYSLALGIAQTNTSTRLREFGNRHALPQREVQAWVDAFQFIQVLRLRHQHTQSLQDQAMDNRINPDDLNQLERRILKEALLCARELQQRLALDYQL
jgi:CBS domain-containing protein